jgi:hypothetical protein
MEELREKIAYKNVPITICMKDFNHMEQYEIIRLILAYNRGDISICTHESTSPYVDDVLKKLPVQFIQCFSEVQMLQQFDLRENRESH